MSKPKCCQKQTANEIKQAAELLRIIAEPNRLKILCVLKNSEECVCDIQKHIGLAQNLTSHHLKVLKQAGLIKAQKEDKIFLLEIKADPNDKIIQVLKQICHFGQFNIHDKRGKLINTIKVEPGSIVVIAERDFINKEISYPRFYNIFDTALII